MRQFPLNFPYVGTTAEGNEIFQYFLLKITTRSALVAFPPWLVNQSHFSRAQKINLHLGGLIFKQEKGTTLEGEISLLEPSSGEFGQLYRVVFEVPLVGEALVCNRAFESLPLKKRDAMVLELVKDSLLIKGGVSVYLKHLLPFLSRILTLTDRSYDDLKKQILEGMRLRVQKNIARLEVAYRALLSRSLEKEGKLCHALEVDQLRDIFYSEFDAVLVRLACGGGEEILQSLVGKFETYSIRSYQTYIASIKALEGRLYSNLNSLTYIYVNSIATTGGDL